MKRSISAAAFICAALAVPAWAGLKPGDPAPDFTADAAVGGKDFVFSLSKALKKGPVVLYFYPKSFTRGCTIEAHEFAEAAESFAEAGATLIGMSKDTIETQRKFSTEECRDKFPVAADPELSVIRSYDAVRIAPTASGETVSDRISYVIGPEGKIIYAYADPAPDKHIENTLAIVRQWRNAHKD
ncbi:peroxiredoxin [Methylocapsa acidiphila]|uniref:peroxiredoxin n=1 Tax=Methylocapsa acidiphila TaxID=133552 RepID=UPI00047B143B|nr:redoxin domain-containing protein [Methylocapsa acidiphila]